MSIKMLLLILFSYIIVGLVCFIAGFDLGRDVE
jgi:hypothetical protein